MRRPAAVLGALLTAGAVLLPAGPAAAGETLAPGGSQTLDVALPDWASRADELGVSVDSLVQFENDCVEPESEAGDESCGAEDGELADFLDATVAGGTDDGGGCRATSEPVGLDLSGGGDSVFDAVGVTCLVLALEFPNGGSDDNRAQSDTLTFILDVVGEEQLGDRSAVGDEDGSPGAVLRADPASDGTIPGGATTSGRTAADGTLGEGAAAAAGGGADPADGAGAAGGGTAAAAGTESGRRVGGPTAEEAGGPAGEGVVGSMATPVTVDGDGLSTESGSTSLAGQALAWGSLFLGAIVLGGLAFVLARRRPRERAA
ncbi:hypothetical protein SAMN05660209_00532 [Geodermatophilus africanus]|uniref:LPXTG-motif cell wall anchor domain-containing protein n=1 Tax=Geodermatophilus africanus TaxID=1137993 RepID=A0A1H3BSI1_9ACTN|nr:hypothetical protein [Geodermatophilus africanus]SDX44324.1 hypothetical protein SAMN05660209_00532 [Geodermatophilus africanus]